MRIQATTHVRVHAAHTPAAPPLQAPAGPHRTLAKHMSVRERFATLEQRFQPEQAKGVDATFQFNLSGPGGGSWYVKISTGKISCKPGTGPNPTVTISATAEDYGKIANDEMSSTWAYLRGKLKVEGDKGLAKQFKGFFREP